MHWIGWPDFQQAMAFLTVCKLDRTEFKNTNSFFYKAGKGFPHWLLTRSHCIQKSKFCFNILLETLQSRSKKNWQEHERVLNEHMYPQKDDSQINTCISN